MNTEINCDMEQEPCPVGKLLRSANPATLDFIGDVQETPPTAIREILDRARQAQHDWEQVHTRTRINLLKNALQYIRDHIEEIAFTIASETGKPKIEAVNSDIITAIGVGDFTVHNLSKVLKPYLVKMGRIGNLLRLLGRYSYIYPKPVGVVGIISPWNYPFGIPFSQVIMAVAAGNAVILKPSTETPLTGLRIQEVFDEAGFPPGLVQAIPGTGSGIGNALVESGVDRIIFTGSVDVGRQVMARAVQRLTPVTLELGGKDAMVVFDDADLDRAATAAVFGSFLNAGQTCVGVKRIYVQHSIYEKFLARLKEKVESLKQGWGWDDLDVSIGPLINARAIGD
ncbi:MAG TPA: aldehyde dehydrogenase family protein, partial [Candidatus Lokiarchaeia archaeon]|nr:aldehyde dehydrogenase family protein [Candidatus Lokiarchaeia archaeon]